MPVVKPCLAAPGERTQKVLVCINFLWLPKAGISLNIPRRGIGAYSSWISIWLRAHFVRERDGKAGRKTSTEKDLKSVLKPFAHIPLLKPSVPCVITMFPETWMTSRRQPSVSSRALNCWTKRCSERVF
jgi:hypothetical protein